MGMARSRLFSEWSGPDLATIVTLIRLGTPIALAVMHLTGGAITIINSMVPTMILIIGIADAVHLKSAFRAAQRPGT